MKHGRHFSFSFQIAYSVSDFAMPDDPYMPRGEELAFKRVQQISISKLRQAGLAWLIDELEFMTADELIDNDILLTEIEFSEFDSPNWTHASGYFDIDVYCADFGYATLLGTRYENHINEEV